MVRGKLGKILGIFLAVSVAFSEDHPLEKGDPIKPFLKFWEGKASKEEIQFLKALFDLQKIEVPAYMHLFAEGVFLEKKGDLKGALERYLASIKEKPSYNPSYFRFNFLIRKVEDPQPFRERIEKILRDRFKNPPPVIVENPPEKYLFLVEKMSQYMFVYKGKELEAMYPVTTGRDWEDKWREGDKRTPEGIYYFTEFIPPHKLPKMYGGIAVVLNYPNPVDKLLGKGGSGIWLHGSDEENRNQIPFSTRGCVVADNRDLREIVKKIVPENTLIAVFKEIPTNIPIDDVKAFLKEWEKAWENKDFERYISLYSKKFTWKGGGIKAWERYKRRVILGKKWIEVEIEKPTIVAFRRGLSPEVEYYVAEFRQVYRSDTYKDVGFKRLYIVNEDGELKILKEEFRREG